MTDSTERELRALVDLAVARDAEGAVKALTEHIERTTAALLAYAESHTDPGRTAGIPA